MYRRLLMFSVVPIVEVYIVMEATGGGEEKTLIQDVESVVSTVELLSSTLGQIAFVFGGNWSFPECSRWREYSVSWSEERAERHSELAS